MGKVGVGPVRWAWRRRKARVVAVAAYSVTARAAVGPWVRRAMSRATERVLREDREMGSVGESQPVVTYGGR